MHRAQLAVLNDTARRKCLLAGRRGGKTHVANAGLIEAVGKHPGSVALYLSLTGKQARNNLWPQLLGYNARYPIGLEPSGATMTAKHLNGGTIEISGADAENAVERLRGRAYSRVIIDEAASFSPAGLEYLCDEVLGPALADYEGDLWLVGTPGAILAGYFYERTEGSKRWPTYRCTMRDNPFFAGRADRLMAEAQAERGWTPQTPAYLREYEGLWVRDTTSLVFDYDPARNAAGRAPDGAQYVIACDLGTSAKRETTAFVVMAYARGKGATAVHAKRHGLLCPSDVGAELARLVTEYDPHAIVMDQGGLGAGYIEEIRRRFRIPIKPAQKQNKLGYVDLLNGDLRKGQLRVVPETCADLVGELTVLQWHESREQYDDRFADHCCDAFLYAYRECQHYIEEEPPPPLPPQGMDARQIEMEAYEDEPDEEPGSLAREIYGATG